jgi:hypothetical protein
VKNKVAQPFALVTDTPFKACVAGVLWAIVPAAASSCASSPCVVSHLQLTYTKHCRQMTRVTWCNSTLPLPIAHLQLVELEYQPQHMQLLENRQLPLTTSHLADVLQLYISSQYNISSRMSLAPAVHLSICSCHTSYHPWQLRIVVALSPSAYSHCQLSTDCRI